MRLLRPPSVHVSPQLKQEQKLISTSVPRLGRPRLEKPSSPSFTTAQTKSLLAPPSKRRTELCFDLENRPLAYWYDGETTSEITAFGWKWSDEKHVHTMLLRPDGDFDTDDGTGNEIPREMAYQLFAAELAEAGIVYGHNIRRHDLPMLNAALVRMQLPMLSPMLTSDTCRDLPRRNGLSYSLENMAAMYGLKGKKHTMSQPMWEEANRLTESGVALARVRVVSDVVLQERLRAKLLTLGILKPPRVWSP